MSLCRIPQCQNTVHVIKRGLCKSHYHQENSGRPFSEVPFVEYEPCSIHGCTRQKTSRGLCTAHASVGSRHKIETTDLVRLYKENWCYACRATVPTGGRMHIDHDHSCCPGSALNCGQCTRGTLCSTCNTQLGRYRDSPPEGGKLDTYLKNAPHFIRTVPWVPIYKKH